jgi:hypothetical protein
MELKNSYLHCNSLNTMKEHSCSVNENIQPTKPHHVTDKKDVRYFQSPINRKVDQRVLNQRYGYNN